MHSKDEKKTILTNLSRLKYATRKYDERISITPDYTPEERKMIKELVKEARRRNTNEAKEEYLWKVREFQIVNIYTSRAQIRAT